MMELAKAKKFMEERIGELEKSMYMFDQVLKPRAEADKLILEKLREQHLKLSAMMEKVAKGEDVTQQDVYDMIPPNFR